MVSTEETGEHKKYNTETQLDSSTPIHKNNSWFALRINN
jgi:hypothetical protein